MHIMFEAIEIVSSVIIDGKDFTKKLIKNNIIKNL